MKFQRVIMNCTIMPVMLLVSCFSAGISGAELKKAGEAEFRFLFFSIYDAVLYTPEGEYRHGGTQPLTLTLTYGHAIPGQRLVSETGNQWRKIGITNEKNREWLEELSLILPDVKRGDSLTLNIDDAGNSEFLLNGVKLGEISDPEFGESFAAIWLCPCSTDPSFTARLTGNKT